jgi:hypothetical protein
MPAATPARTGHNLLVLDEDFAGLVTGLNRRWIEFLLQ